MIIPHQKLLNILDYNPETGIWTWCHPERMNKKPISAEAGTVSVHGYRIITIFGTKYRAAKLAWFYMTGDWPVEEIDHIDRDKLNDRWNNLRDVSRSVNALNRDQQTNNTSGARGVHWDSARSKWFVQVKKDGANHFCGRYDDFIEAVDARDFAATSLHGSNAIPNLQGEVI